MHSMGRATTTPRGAVETCKHIALHVSAKQKLAMHRLKRKLWRACKKFDRYLNGLELFELGTDHKPLIPLINNHSLDNVPLHCQRMLMRLMRFNACSRRVRSRKKNLIVACTLSRSPLASMFVETDTHTVMLHATWLVG